MLRKSIIKTLLNVKDIVITGARILTVGGIPNLIIEARQPKRKQGRCPICGRKCGRYDKGRGKRFWRAPNFGTVKTYIEADAPRVSCPEHGVITEKVEWGRHGSEYTYEFENMVAWLTLYAPKTVIAQYMSIAWKTVGAIVERVTDELEAMRGSLFSNLTCIGIDETSYKKGRKYMTVIVDHTTGRLIWAQKGHGEKVLDEFFGLLTGEQREGIKHVTADGAKYIAESVQKWLPNAERSIDPFHVVQWVTDALDDVRREIWQKAREQEKKAREKQKSQKKVGRPQKTDTPKEKKMSDVVKGSRYALWKNPDDLSADQEATIELLAKQNPSLYRAYYLKEKMRLVFQHTLDAAEPELMGFINHARRCRIPQFVELQRKILRHKDAILSAIKYGLSNARIEAINNKIKVTTRMAYGFRNIDNLLALVKLRCSDLGSMLSLPWMPKLTHT